MMKPCDIDSVEFRLDNIPLPGYPLMYNEGFDLYTLKLVKIKKFRWRRFLQTLFTEYEFAQQSLLYDQNIT